MLSRFFSVSSGFGSLIIVCFLAKMVKNLPAMQETQVRCLVWEDSWRREWLPTPVFLPGESDGQRSLVWATVHGVAKRHDWVTNTFTLALVSLGISCVMFAQLKSVGLSLAKFGTFSAIIFEYLFTCACFVLFLQDCSLMDVVPQVSYGFSFIFFSVVRVGWFLLFFLPVHWLFPLTPPFCCWACPLSCHILYFCSLYFSSLVLYSFFFF